MCNGFGRCFPAPFFGGFHHHGTRFFFGFGSGAFVNSWGYGAPYYGYAAPIYYGGDTSYPVQSDADAAERQRLLNDLEEERRRTDELRDQVAELRASTPVAAPPVAVSPERPVPPTTLVFRDKHQLQVQNYAILGNFLYEMGQHWTRKVALSDLDLPATVAENEKRGIEFQLPPKKVK